MSPLCQRLTYICTSVVLHPKGHRIQAKKSTCRLLGKVDSNPDETQRNDILAVIDTHVVYIPTVFQRNLAGHGTQKRVRKGSSLTQTYAEATDDATNSNVGGYELLCRVA